MENHRFWPIDAKQVTVLNRCAQCECFNGGGSVADLQDHLGTPAQRVAWQAWCTRYHICIVQSSSA
jgi:hypothetical protein